MHVVLNYGAMEQQSFVSVPGVENCLIILIKQVKLLKP